MEKIVDQAEIHREAMSSESTERKGAVNQLLFCFADLPDKRLAWEDLIQLIQDKDVIIGLSAAYSFGVSFLHIPDKEQAWGELHRLTYDEGAYS